MGIQEEIRTELKKALRNGDQERRDALRVILGEFQREATKILPDPQAVKVLRRLAKEERERLGFLDQKSSVFLEITESLLPAMMSEEEIRGWIRDHVDLSKYRNPMQAMKQIMGSLAGRVEGDRVRRVLEEQGGL